MRFYRTVCLLMMLVFAAVGLMFLLIPGQVLAFFDSVSPALGLPLAGSPSIDLYHVLAVAYMYVVALLAFLMYRYPENDMLPLLLVHGKLASSLLSLAFFILYRHYLIYITNSVVDGIIGVTFLMFYIRIRKNST